MYEFDQGDVAPCVFASHADGREPKGSGVYRLYHVGADGFIIGHDHWRAPSDAEAVRECAARARGFAMELRWGNRVVKRFPEA